LFQYTGTNENGQFIKSEGFLFGGISPPNKKFLLCDLSVSAVKILFSILLIGLEIKKERDL
jgi:hypothetical protein